MLKRTPVAAIFITMLAMIVLPLSMRFRVAGSGPLPRFAGPPVKPVRRALLVGINHYSKNNDFGNLRGPLNDVTDLGKLLTKKYGFQVQTLPEEQATHVGIIAAFRKHLIADAGEGDVCLFYFSGHGTQINNSKSPEDDKLDEALVPIDVKRPVTEKKDVKEIRDKELAELYNEAIDKHVKLAVIVDSCHSGSTARGISAGRVKKMDALLTVDMAVPPDPPNRYSESPEGRGALVIAAALDNELAEERPYEGINHSDFSKALVDVLEVSDANKITVEQLFLNVSARLRHEGLAQHPTLGKTREERRKLTLCGDEPAGDAGQTEVTVIVDEPNETLVVQNGKDIGLTRGSEFKRKDGPSVRIRISEEVTELGSAVAEVISPGKLTDIKTGDIFEQDRWASPSKPSLKVWIPAANLSASQIQEVADELSKIRTSDKVQWVYDPTEEVATHVISYAENAWQLTGPEGKSAQLGAQPTAETVLKLLSATAQSKPSLFVYLPPSGEVRKKIKLGEGTAKSAIVVTSTHEEALYFLVGRWTPENIEYAWVLATATQGDSRNLNNKPRSESLALPPLTDWVNLNPARAVNVNATTTEKDPITRLENTALRLGKIKGWLSLTSPAPSRGHIFPYHLLITDSAGAEIKDGSKLVECGVYKLFLVAEPRTLNPLPQPRHVYILGIDKYGNSELIYGEGNDSNSWPKKADLELGKPPSTIPLPNADFIVLGPQGRCGNDGDNKPYGPGSLGPETYILITTEDPLPQPELLGFDGVRSPRTIAQEKARMEEARKKRGERSGPGAEDLQNLLTAIGGTSFTTRGPTSLNWSVQQLSFRSVEKK
jgi:caspase domain-containing protein